MGLQPVCYFDYHSEDYVATVAGSPPAALLGVAFLGAIASLTELVDSVCDSSLDVDSKEIKLSKLLQAVAKKSKKRPCLVMDEANIGLNGEKQSKKLLNMICSATKEERWLNAVLCSSTHSYPLQLAETRGIHLQLVLASFARFGAEPQGNVALPYAREGA